MKTYVIGNKQDFAQWCKSNGVQSVWKSGVTHIPNEYSARGVVPLPGPIKFVVLPSAESRTIATLSGMGYEVRLVPRKTEAQEETKWVTKSPEQRWIEAQRLRASMRRYHWKRYFELIKEDRQTALHHRGLAESIKLDKPHPLS